MLPPGVKRLDEAFIQVLKLFSLFSVVSAVIALKRLFTNKNTETHRDLIVTREQCIRLCFL